MLFRNDIFSRSVAAIIAVTVLAAPARLAAATFFDIDGVVQTCNALVCDAAGIGVGDPVSGFIEIDDAASGPNSTFTEADLIAWELTIGGLSGSGDASQVGPSSLTTDGDGEIVSGTADFTTEVDTGLGIAEVVILLDASAGTWEASTDFFGLGVISTGTINFTRRVDSDGDGIADVIDNCIEVPNADQRDTDGDLFGNVCDTDLNNDNITNAIDLGIFKSVFFTADANADFNGDGIVNVIDLGLLRLAFFGTPGPSGLPNACGAT